ncbi:MAG: hypothetical protein J1G01_05110 [Clostridiales bacterium]|nr:hypothetical protein [Clostridiales bacterium]
MKKLRVIVCALLAFLFCFTVSNPTIAFADNGEREKVYVGGFPIGISIDVGGLLVESVTGVETEYGYVNVDGLQQGDIILSIDGIDVTSVEDISELLTSDVVTVDLLRGGDKISVEIKPVLESYSMKPRLGVKIKDRIYGVGTVTFVREDGRFTALGHEIYDGDTGVHIPFSGGHIHACKILGVKRGKRGEAGAILASIMPEKEYGTVVCNNNFGIAGKFEYDFDKSELLTLARRDEVRTGGAKIKTAVNGKPEYFDVEIIKAMRQSGRKEKGMVFRITDKRLLEMTGGIVRGMSGSPIIQNGKVIGAVTHVFLNDFTKGYGVYADFLN